MTSTMRQVLTIAGSDSGGGAGIQADIKAIQANGVYAASVITAVTAQNTREVRDAYELPPAVVRSQMEAVFDDLDIAAAKTGMLSSTAIIETVAEVLRARGPRALVVDPVMVSKSGYRLLRDDAVEALSSALVPLALVVTPNVHEASLLADIEVDSLDAMREAARRIHSHGAEAVVVKGGHAPFAPGTDILYDGLSFVVLEPEYVAKGVTVHGTGCTFSAAIAARLALDEPLTTAVANAKRYTTNVIKNAPRVGGGHPPGQHFYFMGSEDFKRR